MEMNCLSGESEPRESVAHTRRLHPKAPNVAIQVRHRFQATAQTVFDAWLDPRLTGRWLFATASRPVTHVAIDARVGGAFCLVERENGRLIEHTGEYLDIASPHRLAFTLSLENHPRVITRVTVQISAVKRGCDLTVRHENLPQECARTAEARWTGMLYGLGVTL